MPSAQPVSALPHPLPPPNHLKRGHERIVQTQARRRTRRLIWVYTIYIEFTTFSIKKIKNKYMYTRHP